MPVPIDPQARLCEIDGQKFVLLRRGPKNSRISKLDPQNRVLVGESFLVQTSRIASITSADSLWLNEDVAHLQAKPSQTIRIDGDVATQLQTFASRYGESMNDALRRLLRLAQDGAANDDQIAQPN